MAVIHSCVVVFIPSAPADRTPIISIIVYWKPMTPAVRRITRIIGPTGVSTPSGSAVRGCTGIIRRHSALDGRSGGIDAAHRHRVSHSQGAGGSGVHASIRTGRTHRRRRSLRSVSLTAVPRRGINTPPLPLVWRCIRHRIGG